MTRLEQIEEWANEMCDGNRMFIKGAEKADANPLPGKQIILKIPTEKIEEIIQDLTKPYIEMLAVAVDALNRYCDCTTSNEDCASCTARAKIKSLGITVTGDSKRPCPCCEPEEY